MEEALTNGSQRYVMHQAHAWVEKDKEGVPDMNIHE